MQSLLTRHGEPKLAATIHAALGAGSFALIVVPSHDLKTATTKYDPTLTDVPQPEPSHERDEWKPIPGTPFIKGGRGGDDGIRRVLEMVSAAVNPK